MNTPQEPLIQNSPTSVSAPAIAWQGHMAEDTGSTYGPTPCATLIATPTELWLRGTRGDFRLPRAAVSRIGSGKLDPWFFCAVRIHHNLPKVSRELQFKPMGISRRRVFDQLRELGYPVS